MSTPEQISVTRGILADLLEGVGSISLLSVSRRVCSLLQRRVLQQEEKDVWVLEDKNSGCPLGYCNVPAGLLIVLSKLFEARTVFVLLT